MTAINYQRHYDPDGDAWWVEATREGQATPVGYGDDAREALEALLRAEHKATT